MIIMIVIIMMIVIMIVMTMVTMMMYVYDVYCTIISHSHSSTINRFLIVAIICTLVTVA